MKQLIAPHYLYRDRKLETGMAVQLEAGRVSAIRPLGTDPADIKPYVVMPACVDLQVNGGGGALLNSDPTPAGILRIVAAHRARGTGWIMPTVITDQPEVMVAAAEAVIACKDEPGVLGLHIEGPHISTTRRGTHRAEYIRPFDDDTMKVLKHLRSQGVCVMITLAPECVSCETIRQIAHLGVIVSGGHTAAPAACVLAALENGMSCFTHLYNAMPPMTARDPGVVGTAITSRAHCGLIADGIHVSWPMARVAHDARPASDLMFLVSDAMPTVGGPAEFTLYGERIRLREGRLINAEGSLAGAHIDMLESLRNVHTHLELPLAQSIAMVTHNPMAALGLPAKEIEIGGLAEEMLFLDTNLHPIGNDE